MSPDTELQMPDEHVTTTALLTKSAPDRRCAARRVAAAAAVRLQTRAHHSRNTCAFPEDFSQRPAPGGDPHTLRRSMALPELAGGPGLGHPLTAGDGRQDAGSER